ncbi:MAG: signal peptide prediction [Caldimonas sp.]
MKRYRRLAVFLWAAPCSAIGAALGGITLLAGGKARVSSGALEFCFRPNLASCGLRARNVPFRGIVFGHVILAVTREELQAIGPHERVHVAQYERWGPLFFLAYGVSSFWQLANGRDPYWNNHFEVQARALSMTTPSPAVAPDPSVGLADPKQASPT